MITPITNLDSLNDESCTDAIFKFTNPEELRIALIDTLHTLTGNKCEISLTQENADKYKFRLFSESFSMMYFFEKNIVIEKDQIKMRIRLPTGQTSPLYGLAKNFTEYVDKIHNT